MRYACYKYFSSFFRNMLFLYLIFYFKKYLLLLPFSPIQYLYVIPFALFFHSSLDFYFSCRKHRVEDSFGASNALISSLACLFLSPFLQWWLNFLDNRYFFVSAQLFLLSVALFLFNFSGVLRRCVSEFCAGRLPVFAKFARLFVLFGLVAPLLAFLVATLYGQSNGNEVYYMILHFASWKRMLLLLPVFVLCALADLARYSIEKGGFEPSE